MQNQTHNADFFCAMFSSKCNSEHPCMNVVRQDSKTELKSLQVPHHHSLKLCEYLNMKLDWDSGKGTIEFAPRIPMKIFLETNSFSSDLVNYTPYNIMILTFINTAICPQLPVPFKSVILETM